MSDPSRYSARESQLVAAPWWTLGAFMVVLGVVSIIAPLAVALALEALLGVLLLLAGAGAAVFAWQFRIFEGSVWRVLRAACFLGAGILLFAFPLSGVMTLALVLGVLFLFEGILQLLTASLFSGSRTWVLADGVLGTLLGVVILAGWPGNSAWVVGLLVGLRLLLTGSMLMMVGSVLRRIVAEGRLEEQDLLG